MKDKYDLPEPPKPKSDNDIYPERLPDVSSIEEFIGDKADWSEDISEVKKNKKGKKK